MLEMPHLNRHPDNPNHGSPSESACAARTSRCGLEGGGLTGISPRSVRG